MHNIALKCAKIYFLVREILFTRSFSESGADATRMMFSKNICKAYSYIYLRYLAGSKKTLAIPPWLNESPEVHGDSSKL